jgi:glycopeptide antibiotics resistance protein
MDHARNPAAAKEPESRSVLTIVLFAVYALLLVSVILFKFPFDYQLESNGRVLNLIPFAGSFAGAHGFDIGDVLENVLIFVPLGIYISMLRTRWSFGRTILTIAVTSVAFEVIQYIFAIGRSDITDVIDNTLGGLVGIGIYALSVRVFGSRTNRVLSIVALVVTVVAVAFFTFLKAHSK